MGGHLQHLWLHRGRVLVFFLIVHICNIQAFAETKHHHHGKTAAKAEPFIISTDKPFDTLMYEAMDIMHRDMGFGVSVFKLKPDTIYKVYISGQKTPVALLKTNPKGMSNVTTIGPLRETITTVSPESPEPSQILVMEGDEVPDLNKAILLSVL